MRGRRRDPPRITSYNVCYTKLLRVRAFNGLALAIVVPTGKPDKIVNPDSDRKLGEIVVRVSSKGLEPAEVRLMTQP